MVPMFLINLVGEKAGRIIMWALLGLVAIAMLFVVVRCTSHDNTAQKQAEQTSASGEAIANAASSAIQTIGNRTATEADVDAATAQTLENIDNAQDPDLVRGAVIAGLCGQASHRNDPACLVQ